jgi:hypothetical protein
MVPINLLDRALISYAFCKSQSRACGMRSFRCLFGTEESQQRAAQDRTDGGYANKEGE